MIRMIAAAAFLFAPSVAGAASAPTDFGLRTIGSALPSETQPVAVTPLGRASRVDLRSVASIGAQWGTVTSTYRSAARNRAVGGARNSYHLSGRAIDIARRPGVRHADIAAAFRNAGYHLVESLDEGDHSHFAFGTAAAPVRLASRPKTGFAGASSAPAPTQWRVVSAPIARR